MKYFKVGFFGCLGTLAAFLVLVIIAALVEQQPDQNTATEPPFPPATNEAASKAANYLLVTTIRGAGDKTTAAFTVRSPWKLTYTWTRTGSSAWFGVSLYDPSIGFRDSLVSTGTPDTDSTWVHSAGTFYLKIRSLNARYTLKIWAPGPPPK